MMAGAPSSVRAIELVLKNDDVNHEMISQMIRTKQPYVRVQNDSEKR